MRILNVDNIVFQTGLRAALRYMRLYLGHVSVWLSVMFAFDCGDRSRRQKISYRPFFLPQCPNAVPKRSFGFITVRWHKLILNYFNRTYGQKTVLIIETSAPWSTFGYRSAATFRRGLAASSRGDWFSRTRQTIKAYTFSRWMSEN